MKPIEIKFELMKRKIAMAHIARSLDPPVSQPAVQQVIDRKGVSRRIMLAVAQAIETAPEVVFPEYFAPPAGKVLR